MNDGDAPCFIHMRVRVLGGNAAVGGPACVADSAPGEGESLVCSVDASGLLIEEHAVLGSNRDAP